MKYKIGSLLFIILSIFFTFASAVKASDFLSEDGIDFHAIEDYCLLSTPEATIDIEGPKYVKDFLQTLKIQSCIKDQWNIAMIEFIMSKKSVQDKFLPAKKKVEEAMKMAEWHRLQLARQKAKLKNTVADIVANSFDNAHGECEESLEIDFCMEEIFKKIAKKHIKDLTCNSDDKCKDSTSQSEEECKRDHEQQKRSMCTISPHMFDPIDYNQP